MALEMPGSRRVVALLDVDSDGRADIVTRKKQSLRAYAVLTTSTTDEDGVMHWDVESVPIGSTPTSKSWSFLTAE
jgi:hypothetical protein